MVTTYNYSLLSVTLLLLSIEKSEAKKDLLVVAVATNATEGFRRFERSLRIYGLNYQIVGLGEEWLGGEISNGGGGHKLNIFLRELEKHQDNDDLVILFTDSYDVVLTGGKEEILSKFSSLEANIVFGAEKPCWPDASLAPLFPKVESRYKHLNGGALIGYASKLFQLLSIESLSDAGADQLYCAKLFLKERQNLNIKLDTHAVIIQNLVAVGADEVSLVLKEDDARVINTLYNTTPVVIHGNGPSKHILGMFGNYLAKSWTARDGCLVCDDGRINLNELKDSEYPQVMMGIFIQEPTPFLGEMLEKARNIFYPGQGISLFVHNKIAEHEQQVAKWVLKQKNSSKYKFVKYISSYEKMENPEARNLAITECLESSCDVYFYVDSEVQLDNPETLKLLVSYNRSVIAPIMTREGKAWSTFWGNVTNNGYYAGSPDYMDIINNIRKGIWNVALVKSCYVLLRPVMENPETRPFFIYKNIDADVVFGSYMRQMEIFMYASNLDYYGYLVDPNAVLTKRLHPDLWLAITNKLDWENKYLHPDYFSNLEAKSQNAMPCADVFWNPLFTPLFCKHLMETVENSGPWKVDFSMGDKLACDDGVTPTMEILLKQIGYKQEWLYVLKTYIKPLVDKVYNEFPSDAKALLNFVARYRSTEEEFLKSHDSYTYTMSITLLQNGADYKGSESNFSHYNCTVMDKKAEWTLMHMGLQVPKDLLIIAIATNANDGFKKFERSLKVYGLNYKIVGLGEEWLGGEISEGGGGHKINLFHRELEKHKDNDDLVILFTDSYDVILTGGKEEILSKFSSLEADIVFGAEKNCWPDASLAPLFPKVESRYKYLNSGGIIGYASKLLQLLSIKSLADTDADQLYYAKLFLNETTRQRLKIKLDTQAVIIQNLVKVGDEVVLDFQQDDVRLINRVYKTTPVVIHGNGQSKTALGIYGNYLAKSWTARDGCLVCADGRINLKELKDSEYPQVMMGIFIQEPTPFLGEMLEKAGNISYPGQRISLLVYNKIAEHEQEVSKWVLKQKNSSKYKFVKYISSDEKMENPEARKLAITECLESSSDVYFYVDSEVQLDNPETLKLLVSYNRSVIAPIMTREGRSWSTFWGSVSENGYYAKSLDYMDIINNNRRGIWNVALIRSCYVIWRPVLENPETRPKFTYEDYPSDLIFAAYMRQNIVFMHASNLEYYGHLVNRGTVSFKNLHTDLWQVETNEIDWEKKYLHQDYFSSLKNKTLNAMPCTDVFWTPLFTPLFCEHLIATQKNYGQFTGSHRRDNQLSCGHGTTPTVIIRLKQIGFEQEWFYIFKTYIKPLADKVFKGYPRDGNSLVNFVAKFGSSEQSSLRSQDISSTYDINITLHQYEVDYKGDGSNFSRYNCSTIDMMKSGWTLMHLGLQAPKEVPKELLIVSVATDPMDGFKMFERSLKVYNLNYKIVGMGIKWLGGKSNVGGGGGHKVNLLREEMENHKNREDLVVLIVDSYDSIIAGDQEEILSKFLSLRADIIFGAQNTSWPKASLASLYPKVNHGYKYLNSGGYIGYASRIYQLISMGEVANNAYDQLHFTELFLNQTTRYNLDIKLDTQAVIFQNLYRVPDTFNLNFGKEDTRLINEIFNTTPVVIHGNGNSKMYLRSLGNYLAKSWTAQDGCLTCDENRIRLIDMKDSEYPQVMMGIFITTSTAFLEEMLEKAQNISYPVKRISLLVSNQVVAHEKQVSEWVTKQRNSNKYNFVKYIASSDNMKEWHVRNLAISKCLESSCDVYFNVDSDVHLDNPETLKLLISYNRSIVAAVMTRVGKLYSTFWGSVTSESYYKRSYDYYDIVTNSKRGIWNVPHILGCYVIWRFLMENPETRPNYINKMMDADMAFTTNMREKEIFMYAANLEDYGHLVDINTAKVEQIYSDLWQVSTNKLDWENKYLHPDYYSSLDNKTQNLMPCPDVYWFPLFTPLFCKHLIETMEIYGKWSGGNNEDNRLPGGYENVPTDDIHMNQINYENEWLHILKTYIKPLAEKVYIGYDSDARASMNFVVRYKPTMQPLLRPHHDSSTYSINVALNRHGIDYEGGGSNFIRHNCSVVESKIGWTLMHPGQLTHYHEGLQTTKGTRYIMVSFVDP